MKTRGRFLGNKRVGFGLVVLALLTVAFVESGRSHQDSEVDSLQAGVIAAEALFPYTVRLPENYDAQKTYPLIIGLHGFGDTVEQFSRIGEPITKEGFLFAVPQAPYALRIGDRFGYDWSFFRLDQADVKKLAWQLTSRYVLKVTETMKRRYRPSEVFLLGYSQGGSFAFITGFQNPELFDGIISFAGGFSAEWFANDDAPEFRGLEVFIAHGTDDQVVAFEDSKVARSFAEDRGYSVRFVPFEGGHELPLNVVSEMIEWTKSR